MPLDKEKLEGDKKSLLGRAWRGVKWISSARSGLFRERRSAREGVLLDR